MSLERFSGEDALDWWVEYSSKQPVQAAIEAECDKIVTRIEYDQYETEWERLLDRRKLRQMTSWLVIPEKKKALSKEEKFEIIKNSKDLAEARRKLAKIGLERRGRPVTEKRKIAIEALDRLLTVPSCSWAKLPRKFCHCGKPHTRDCQERIRTQVRLLIRLLKVWRIDVDLSRPDLP